MVLTGRHFDGTYLRCEGWIVCESSALRPWLYYRELENEEETNRKVSSQVDSARIRTTSQRGRDVVGDAEKLSCLRD